MNPELTAAALRRVFDDLMSPGQPAADTSEYVLGLPVGSGYVGVSRSGSASLLLPLPARPDGVARAAGGCLLRPASEVAFSFGDRKWNQPAAILECTDHLLLDAFAVLALDVALRSSVHGRPLEWQHVVGLVEEWYALLGQRRKLSPEDELGIWGEVWFLAQAGDVDRLAGGWIGPEGGASDFVIGGVCAEVKTSRSRMRHFVSQLQAVRPMGDLTAHFVSLWVGLDPEAGVTLPALVGHLLSRSHDQRSLLRKLLQTGYSPGDQTEYQKAYLLLNQPYWFPSDDIPRVHLIDPGVSHLRYMVLLDENKALHSDEVQLLTTHFHGASHPRPVALTPATPNETR